MTRHPRGVRVAGRRQPSRHARVRTPANRHRRVLLAVLALVFTGVLATGVTFWLQGYRVYVVYTGSMTPTLRPGDVVIDRPPSHAYRVGEIITFRKSTTDVVTHRIAAVTPNGIKTKGDANRTADSSLTSPQAVKGTVAAKLRGWGYLVVYFRDPRGIASVVTVSLTVLLLWSLFFPPPSHQLW